MTITDYSNRHNWLQAPEQTVCPADIFYVYATAYDKLTDSDPIICEVTHKEMRRTARFSSLKSGSAFETAGDLYIPYYRQTDAPSCLSLPKAEQDRLLHEGPVADILAAFDYYLTHYNQGRPFILAGHSQGADVLRLMMAAYFADHPEVQERLVAAYLIGVSITPDFLAAHPNLKFAAGATDTGVIISYNTEGPGVTIPNPLVQPGALCINPINWQTDATPAAKEESRGSRLLRFGYFKNFSQLADAQIDLERRAVICSTVPGADCCELDIFPPGIFHTADYPLYYYDIRENAKARIAAFLEK